MLHHKQQLAHLTRRKMDLEADIASQKATLDANGVGMNEPLVDNEGYPRSDIDVYKVRHARHRIICLLNDHKALMKDIERGLHTYHTALAQNGNIATASENLDIEHMDDSAVTAAARAFAVVSNVEVGSPADVAGLQSGDHILRFGSVNAGNFQDVKEIATVVRHSIGRRVNVVVRRNADDVPIILVPKQWTGKGVLGCAIRPV